MLPLSAAERLRGTDAREAGRKLKVDRVLTGSECWALPAVLNGKIYLRDGTNIVCVDSSITK